MGRLPDVITTDRLQLRRWQESDVDAPAAAVRGGPEHLRPWMRWVAAEPLSRSDRLDFIRKTNTDWKAGGDLVVGAFLGDVVVGGSGLHCRRGPTTLEIGYWIHVDHTRQ